MTARPTALEVRASGLTLAAQAWGPSDGAPCLALHGWLDNSATFEGLAPLLTNVRVVALDLPGHGLSQHRSADATYAMTDAVADVEAVVRALGWTRFTLLGHSMGAAIAALYAGTFPGKVSRLILHEGLGPLTDTEDNVATRLHSAIEDDARPHHTRVFASHEEAAQRVVAAVPMRLSSARTLLERGLKPVDGGFTWRTDPRLRGASRLRLTEAQVQVFLRAIAAPTLAIRASNGFPFPAPVAEARIAQLRSVQRAEVPGQHHVHLDSPETIAPLMNAFLQQSPAT